MLRTKKHNTTDSYNDQQNSLLTRSKSLVKNNVFVPVKNKQNETDDFSVPASIRNVEPVIAAASIQNVEPVIATAPIVQPLSNKGQLSILNQKNDNQDKINMQMSLVSDMIKSEKQKIKQHAPIIEKKVIYNVINPDDPSTIMVTFNNQTFSFYNNKKSHLGSFSMNQLIKYIVH